MGTEVETQTFISLVDRAKITANVEKPPLLGRAVETAFEPVWPSPWEFRTTPKISRRIVRSDPRLRTNVKDLRRIVTAGTKQFIDDSVGCSSVAVHRNDLRSGIDGRRRAVRAIKGATHSMTMWVALVVVLRRSGRFGTTCSETKVNMFGADQDPFAVTTSNDDVPPAGRSRGQPLRPPLGNERRPIHLFDEPCDGPRLERLISSERVDDHLLRCAPPPITEACVVPRHCAKVPRTRSEYRMTSSGCEAALGLEHICIGRHHAELRRRQFTSDERADDGERSESSTE